MFRSHPAKLLVLFAVVCLGCQQDPPRTTPANPYAKYGAVEIEFSDDVQTNTTVDGGALELTFLDTKGNKVELAGYRGKKNIVLVFTRGFSGAICPFCTTQTSRLISNYPEFVSRDAEVLLVYPGDKKPIEEFLAAAKEKTPQQIKDVPFPVLLDESLDAVNRLNIKAELASPSTYILDKQGQVRFAYVGAGMNDRPSIAAMLTQLDAINAEAIPAANREEGKPAPSEAKPGT